MKNRIDTKVHNGATSSRRSLHCEVEQLQTLEVVEEDRLFEEDRDERRLDAMWCRVREPLARQLVL
jgi:hypothetical protein